MPAVVRWVSVALVLVLTLASLAVYAVVRALVG